MLMPTVHRYMTANPYTVAPCDSMARAHRLMREHGFRHLPVVEDGRLVGMLSDRDLHLVRAGAVDPEKIRVAEAMTRSVLAVTAEMPLDEAIELMSTSSKHSLVVLGTLGAVVGILTSSDALWALTDLLRREAA